MWLPIWLSILRLGEEQAKQLIISRNIIDFVIFVIPVFIINTT
jgi:hypothetical protein